MADDTAYTAPLVPVLNTEEETPPPPQSAIPESVSVSEKETPHLPPPDSPVIEADKPQPIEQKKTPESLVSFKEESNRVSDLLNFEKRALDDLKKLVREAINNHEFTYAPPPPPSQVGEPKPSAVEEKQISAPEAEIQAAQAAEASSESDIPPPTSETEIPPDNGKQPETEITSTPEEVSIWGVPLLKDDRSDVILLKFLRAREFKVRDAFIMLKNTFRWRQMFSIDALVDEDLGDDLEKVVFMHGFDKEGHPVCYNVYGEFQNKELYHKTFADEEKRTKFLRWRIQFLERSIRKLDFSPGGICTIFQVSDLKNSPGPGKRELRLATRQALQLLQDNYPEFVAKQVFINVPWWYLAFYTMISPFLTQRTRSKFVFASPARTAEILFKYIAPEQVPIQYGGLSVDFCDCNPEFTINDPTSEITVKPATKQTVEILVNEKCIIVWELRVVGWEVSYSSEYVPSAEGGYTIIIHKAKKMTPTDEPVVSSSFKISELGKILLTVDNPTSKKKKLLYRFKVKPFCD